MPDQATYSFNSRLFWLFGFFFIAVLGLSIVAETPGLIFLPFLLLIGFPVITQTFTTGKRIFWLLICTLPLSTEVNFTPTLGTDFPDEILMLGITAVFLLAVWVNPRLMNRQLIRHPLFSVLLLQLLWILIAVFFSQKPSLSLKFLLAKSWYIIPFVVLPQLFISGRRSFYVLSLCLLIPLLVVMLQSVIRHAFFGFSFESINKTLSPFFRNHVNYGAQLVCCMPIAGALYLMARNKFEKKICIGLLVFFTLALFLTYSRGAWLCLFTGFAGFIAILRKWVSKAILVVLIVGTVVVGWLTADNNYERFAPDYTHTYFHTDLSEHLSATYSMKDISNAERIYRWVAGFRMSVVHPVTGFGPNTFYSFYKGYTDERFKTYVSDNEEHSTVHNYFLLTLIEQGVPGLVLFILLIWVVLYTAQRAYHQRKDFFTGLVAITTGVIFTMIITLNMLSDLVETDKLGSLFYLCIGVLISIDKLNPSESLTDGSNIHRIS